MENAINAFVAATSETEIRAAYDAMLAWADTEDDDQAVDEIDNMLNQCGLPSLADKLVAAEFMS
jgi:hypothetical protein